MRVGHLSRKAVTVAVVSAALVSGGTAAAFATSTASTTTVMTATAGARDPGDAAAFDAKFAESTAHRLATLAAIVHAFEAKVDALPTTGLTLTPWKASALKHLLTFVTDIQSRLAALPTTGPAAPTAGEASTITSLQSSLAALRAHLTAVLANATIAAPTVAKTTRTKSFDPRLHWFFGLRWWDRRTTAGTGTHHCDGGFHR